MSSLGAFILVLHGHIPYCRRAGYWPHGEVWLYEAIAETYLPLLSMLDGLQAAGVRCRVLLGFTPILLEQLADTEMLARFEDYVQQRITAAERDATQASSNAQVALARWYGERYQAVLADFRGRYNRDIIGGFKRLYQHGAIELMASMATHCYTPLVARDSTIHAQIATGLATFERYFGHKPGTFWLPECGYRPAYYDDETGIVKPGLETFLAAHNITCFFTDSHLLEGRSHATTARALIDPPEPIPQRRRTTFLPYRVAGSNVVVLGRDRRTSERVWSSDYGYPGNGQYREFHRKAPESGLNYWRITDRRIPLEAKDWYDPDSAARRAVEHATDFATTVSGLLTHFSNWTGQYGLVTAMYDMELFGHWWFEGVTWLEAVLSQIARNAQVDLATPADLAIRGWDADPILLTEGSWGWQGDHSTWQNPDLANVWPQIHEAELRMERLVAHYQATTSDHIDSVMRQIARELLLLQSSDWPFLITAGTAREYSTQRFALHHERFRSLATRLEQDCVEEAIPLARQWFEQDNPFPDIDWRAFAAREAIVKKC